VTLVIVSYNSCGIIKQCQDELLKSGAYRIIIIDNGSPDGSAERLQKEYPEVEVVALPQNIGYGRAANIGIEKTTTPYAYLLNPDLYATAEIIEKMLETAAEYKGRAAIFSPAVKPVNYTQTGCRECKWISGSSMLFDLEEMKEIGFFDEHIFLFSEESDLCLRTRKAGKKIVMNTDIYLKHLKGQACPSSPELIQLKGWHFGWSRAYYRAKHQMDHGEKSARRQILNYTYKALTSFDQTQRLKYKARAAGARAFLSGTPAFDSTGTPAQSLQL
ncbi:MAG TPA: glycosyltransferase family 2 protein, partial [Pontiella sp.]|nr:glycosyltransferase family 2 protein [Pontiella sp.]